MTGEQIGIDFTGVQQELPFIEELFGDKELQQKSMMERTGLKSVTLLKLIEKGCNCPVCGQYMKRYQYTITGEMVRVLIVMYKHFRKYPHSDPLNMEVFIRRVMGKDVPRGNKHALLRHWGLIKDVGPRTSKSTGKRQARSYRITELGDRFVRGFETVEKYIYIYDNKLLGKSDERITIYDCIGKKFNYDELMEAPVL